MKLFKTRYYCPHCRKGVINLFVTKDKFSPYPLYTHLICKNVVEKIQKKVVPMIGK